MHPDEHLQALTREGQTLADVAEGHLHDRVPPCPDWDVADLLHHLGTVQRWVIATVAEGGERAQFDRPERPEDAALVAWFREGHQELLTALSADPQTRAWTFSPAGSDVGWWRRRQALEAAVHRWDVQAAAGQPQPIDAELAVEGIDEMLLEFAPMTGREPIEGLAGSLHLHSTDVDGEWLVDFDADPRSFTRQHAKADTALRGPASGLYLWLWNRQTPDEAGLEVFGPTAVVEAWHHVKI